MEQRMELLKDLQGLDTELYRVREERRQQEEERAALDAEAERIRTQVEALSADLEALQAERRELASAIDLEQENVRKAEERLPTIKTQKEYVAVLKEIDTAKKLNKELQEKIAAKDEELAALEKDREEKKAQLDAFDEQSAARREEIAKTLGEFEEKVEEKQRRREKLLEELPARLRKRYELVLSRREGLAVVEARGGACLGCNMHLPPQLFNSLFTQREIQTCPHCHRILFANREE